MIYALDIDGVGLMTPEEFVLASNDYYGQINYGGVEDVNKRICELMELLHVDVDFSVPRVALRGTDGFIRYMMDKRIDKLLD